LLDAEREYYFALAMLQAVLGLDPLEQSLGLDQSVAGQQPQVVVPEAAPEVVPEPAR
jgi:hypothetical protein